jgi:hypothetical protein
MIAFEHRQERERIERLREECHAEPVQRPLAGEHPDTSELEIAVATDSFSGAAMDLLRTVEAHA